MEVLKAERKNSIASCASNGYVLAYDNHVLTVGFKMKFLCERMQKPDYREVVEEALLRIARVPVKLQCVVDTGGSAGNKSVAGKAAAGSAKSAPASETTGHPVPESTRKAMEMFGATLHRV